MTEIADDYTTWDAAYVLGALGSAERREYEEHLAGCPECRAAVTELAGLPGMLALVDAETAEAMIGAGEEQAPAPAAPDLLPTLAAAAERRRRRSRWVAVGAALAGAAAAVAIAVPVLAGREQPAPPVTAEQVLAERSMSPVEPTPIAASFRLLADGDRTRVVMTCDYGAGEQAYTRRYRLAVIGADGSRVDLGEWPAGPGTSLTVDSSVDLAPEQVRRVEITSAETNRVLLTGDV
ncbi:zf-HC2 domain-containing protein [Nocardia farcinica]|uniref:Predicted transmembrane transcriptional regulator (Anti-sigma factor) n=2 Tax=Nocardia farcinica TaxID=37329 RepID=A0A449H5J1_NOCFR|nr:zf-HC2 domain-containing protein [Nocardia farcinica]MBA4858566.1 zf-HC2 domain-containing protein [Nocardia farcinica]MBC9819221.1 zf-HC2 domain-containing protein [Nocardia farcinica]MBF6312258.1 zf-HC2 domain-containing protein [Nocardia farcinica]UEX22815.1 zf-HC2 domain-containing protein [Nocardia farcinica]VFA93237.1 Predicted transmembrane transcriptional regulator (anti-sigma factor) [Nocardia farcinica]